MILNRLTQCSEPFEDPGIPCLPGSSRVDHMQDFGSWVLAGALLLRVYYATDFDSKPVGKVLKGRFLEHVVWRLYKMPVGRRLEPNGAVDCHAWADETV